MRNLKDGMATVVARLMDRIRGAHHAVDNKTIPDSLQREASAVSSSLSFFLDVRPALAEGREPLDDILKMARRVPDGGTLTLEVPFNPIPLRRMLNEAGFQDDAHQITPGHWRIMFRRTNEPMKETSGAARIWHAVDSIHIDVRGLPPPEPMVEIIKLLDSCPAVSMVVVHHEREPAFLYPELDARGWSHRLDQTDPEGVMLYLSRKVPA
jgi:uncharacterized protein (DUF2249 family)